MPLINPEEAIRSSFRGLRNQRRRSLTPNQKEDGCVIVPIGGEPVVKVEAGKAEDELKIAIHGTQEQRHQIQELLLRKVTSKSRSFFSNQQSTDSRDASNGGDSMSSDSVYIVEETRRKKSAEGENHANHELKRTASGSNRGGKDAGNKENLSARDEDGEGKSRNLKTARIIGMHRDEDRRRLSWVPCTCPQYKVSNQLASRKDVQGVFFARVLMIKIIQLLIINIVIFTVGFERESTFEVFKRSHDWAYLSFGFFVALLLTIRVTLSYRARWPRWIAFIMMIPLTTVIAYTTSCITVIYNSVLIPMVTCTVLLTFIMLSFTPYLLKKHVMDRVTNYAAVALALLSSIILVFLKEMESRQITYWDFLLHVWLPGLLLSQIVVQLTVFEIQRMIFGLCFNVASTRWHVAALYL